MSKYGTALQAYNNDLVKGIEELKIRKGKLQAEIAVDTQARDQLQAQIDELTAQLHVVDSRLEKRAGKLKCFEEQISTAEGAFVKILESSQGLLEVLKRYNKPEEFSSGATRESPSVNDGSP